MSESNLSKRFVSSDGLTIRETHRVTKSSTYIKTSNNFNLKKKHTMTAFSQSEEKDQDKSLTSGSNDTSVLQSFYGGANVLVTGATGFVGKLLIEKLLRSCPDIEKIFLVVREKKGRSVEKRVDDIVSSPCFNRIKEECPSFRSKLVAVGGDIGLVGLGIADCDQQSLAKQVDIVFHVAATVRFDEQLNTAILQNVRGTREILNLCRTFRKLRSVVHVSTAYSNCTSLQIDERIYDPPITSKKAILLAETLPVETMNEVSRSMVGKWPNTYAFTKAISEDAVKCYGGGLPVGIFRPTILVCARSEPMPGWIDNLYGPTGVIAGVNAGVLRTMQLDESCKANMAPGDMAVNGLIASAWDVAENSSPNAMPVYNYVSANDNDITWSFFNNQYRELAWTWPPSRSLWYASMTCVSNRWLYLLLRLFLHTVPALLMDLGLVLVFKSPQMIRNYRKIHKFVDVIAFFTTNQWNFEDKNVELLWKKLGPKDRKIFDFDMRSLDWAGYIIGSIDGLRHYMLKDPPDTLPAARRRFYCLYLLHRLTQCVLVLSALWILYTVFS